MLKDKIGVKKIKVSISKEKSQIFPPYLHLSVGWYYRIPVWRALYRSISWLPLCDFNRFKFSRHRTETWTESQLLALRTVEDGRVFAVHEDTALTNERYVSAPSNSSFNVRNYFLLRYCATFGLILYQTWLRRGGSSFEDLCGRAHALYYYSNHGEWSYCWSSLYF